MEIQSDLIILPASSHLPLPWSVRGPLGLETGAEVSVALVQSDGAGRGLPDIIVTPLQSEYLRSTYTLDVELGERPGAVADFLAWLGETIAEVKNNSVNIVLSETITLEGRNRHKMHIVLEPASDRVVSKDDVTEIMTRIKEDHPDDIKDSRIGDIYGSKNLDFILQQTTPVVHGWIQYGDWKRKILELYEDAQEHYDLSKVVVSSNPEQRLLRYIIPRRGVFEIRVPHRNKPGALREISNAIRSHDYNILSSRLSRTPPPDRTAKTSVFVAACEPLNEVSSSEEKLELLKQKLRSIDPTYSIDNVLISRGRLADRTLFLTPRRREVVSIDPEILVDRDIVRAEATKAYFDRHGKNPKKFVFLSKRFIDNKKEHRSAYEEQVESISKIIKGLEASGCAVVEAANPGQDENRYYDLQVYKAVFSRLWACDACAVLALNEDGEGKLSLSIAHEIGFFAGRNRSLKVFVSASRDTQPVFGNIVGMNRLRYADPETAYIDENDVSIYSMALKWGRNICDI